MVCNDILEYMGHTPMIRLNRMNDPNAAEVLVKFVRIQFLLPYLGVFNYSLIKFIV